MDTTEIQRRIDAITKGMTEKGLRQSGADFSFRAHRDPSISLNWAKGNRHYADEYEWIKGSTPEECLANAEAWVAALPTAEQTRMTAFMAALGEAVELGKKNDIDVEFVNPLVVLMKKLSKNALQHKPSEAA